jgi:hypothetical protein
VGTTKFRKKASMFVHMGAFFISAARQDESATFFHKNTKLPLTKGKTAIKMHAFCC